MSEELPEGWVSVPAAEACVSVQSGGTPKGKPFTPVGEVPFLKVYNIVEQRVAFDYRPQFIPRSVHEGELRRSVVRPNDVLMNIVGPPLGKIALVSADFPEWNINQALVAFRTQEFLLSSFLYHYLCEGREIKAIEAEYRGSAGQSNISLSQARSFSVPIAPLPEQHRIVAAAEALLEKVARAKARLDRVAAILKRFRQAVLAAACSGELTREWREARAAADGDDLPGGWKLTSPDDVAAYSANALAIGPFGSNLKVSDYTTSGVPLVFVREIRAERFGGPNTKYVSREKASELRSHIVRGGDLLLTKMGEPPGDTSVYPLDQPEGIITADCIKLTPRAGVALSAYLRLCFRAEPARGQLLERAMGVAQQKLSLARFREVRFPLPPLEEQTEIVRQVDRLFALADTIERRVEVARARAEKLPQAILSKAFSGELVPTEAELARAEGRTYETAEDLLRRVKGQATEAPNAPRKRKQAAERKDLTPPAPSPSRAEGEPKEERSGNSSPSAPPPAQPRKGGATLHSLPLGAQATLPGLEPEAMPEVTTVGAALQGRLAKGAATRLGLAPPVLSALLACQAEVIPSNPRATAKAITAAIPGIKPALARQVADEIAFSADEEASAPMLKAARERLP